MKNKFVKIENPYDPEYNKIDYILDPKWKSLEEFLIFKADYSHQQAREAEDKRKSEALEVIKGKK